MEGDRFMLKSELETVESNFNELRLLVGKLFLDDKFMDLVDLLKLISKNKLILDNLQLICDGVKNGNINKVLDLTYELLNAAGKEEFKDIAEKYGL